MLASPFPQPIGPYSPAVRVGNMLYLSGQIGVNPLTMELDQGIRAQTHRAFQNMKAVIHASGGVFEKIAKITIYLTEMDSFSVVNQIMAEYCKEPFPARSTIGVKELPKNALVEIEGIVALDAHH